MHLLQICVCAADILKVASDVMDLITKPLETFLEEAFGFIENELSGLLPCKSYVHNLVAYVKFFRLVSM